MSTTAEKVAVMTAYMRGSQIQARPVDRQDAEWTEVDGGVWNWQILDYRVKSTVVKPREVWIGVFETGTFGALFYPTKWDCATSCVCTQGGAHAVCFREVLP